MLQITSAVDSLGIFNGITAAYQRLRHRNCDSKHPPPPSSNKSAMKIRRPSSRMRNQQEGTRDKHHGYWRSLPTFKDVLNVITFTHVTAICMIINHCFNGNSLLSGEQLPFRKRGHCKQIKETSYVCIYNESVLEIAEMILHNSLSVNEAFELEINGGNSVCNRVGTCSSCNYSSRV